MNSFEMVPIFSIPNCLLNRFRFIMVNVTFSSLVHIATAWKLRIRGRNSFLFTIFPHFPTVVGESLTALHKTEPLYSDQADRFVMIDVVFSRLGQKATT